MGRSIPGGTPPARTRGVTLLTFGHGTAGADELTDLLHGAGVRSVIDVRRFPGSRRQPHVGRDELASWLPAAGIAYRWEERLGGRRTPDPASPHVGLRNVAFRAYADHLGSEEFATALGEVLGEAAGRTTAVMCSESLWWRCHRRLVADAAVLVHGVDVRHLMHDGRRSEHLPTDVVRLAEDGSLVYDGGAPELPLG